MAGHSVHNLCYLRAVDESGDELAGRPAALTRTGAYGTTVIRLATMATPGAPQAARCASSFSVHDRTLPLRMTFAPSASM